MLACNLIWGGQFVLFKIVQQQTGPVVAALFPTAGAALLLTFFVWHKRRREIGKDKHSGIASGDVWRFIVLGVAGQVVAQLCVAWGVRLTLASNAALLALALPIATAYMAFLLLGERMTTSRWLGFCFAIAGVIVSSGISWEDVNLSGGGYLWGNLLVFAAVNGSAFYNVYSKKLLRQYSPVEVVLYSYCVVVAFLLPIALYAEPQTFMSVADFKPSVWVGFLLLAVFQYFLAMVLFLSVLTRLDAIQAGISNYLITVFGVLIAALVLHERLTTPMMIGGILVLSGTLLVTVYDKRSDLSSGPVQHRRD